MRSSSLARFAILLVSVAAAAPVSAQEHPDGQKANGLVLGVNLSTSATLIDAGASTLALPAFGGGIFLGGKLKRFMFGVGFDLQRLASGTSTEIPATGYSHSSEAKTSILILPGVRIAALRSADRRVEMYGEFDLGWGRSFSSQDPAPTVEPDTSNNRLVYMIGPGVRYWIHPQFAMSALVAVRGDFTWTSRTALGVTTEETRATTSILGGLEFLGVF